MRDMSIRDFIKRISLYFPLNLRLKIIGFIKLGYILDLNSPKTFNEKLNYRKINWTNTLYVKLANKFTVRDFVSKTVGDRYLIPIIYHGDNLTEEVLNFNSGNYVLKTTHDSGVVFFLNEKTSNYEKREILKRVDKSLARDYGRLNDESWYSKSKPSVIIEEMLKDSNGKSPKDYKFHVFNNAGVQKIFIQVDFDRFDEHTRNFYDEKGDLLNIECVYKKNENHLKIHDNNLPEMISVARELAKPFEYVRIDLYSVNESVYFGEITFAHERGFGKFMPSSIDDELGKFWCIENE